MLVNFNKKLLGLSSSPKVISFYAVFTLIYFLIRCVALDQMYMVHDERDIVFSAWSLARSGKDLFGNVFPLSFVGISPDNPLISIWFSALFWLFLPIKSVFFARLPFVLVSSFVPLLVYLIVKKVTKDTRFSILVSLVAGMSPWILHLGRIAMDVTLAFPTLLLSILLLLNKKRLFGYILLSLAFYNYQGFRTVIPFIPFIIEWFMQQVEKRRFFKIYLIHAGFVFLLFLSIFLIDSKVTSSRFDQVLFLNMERFSADVDLKRRETIFPLAVSKIFDSKLTESVRYGLDTVAQGLSTQTFFFKGDASPINGTGIGSLLFISTLPFFIFGLISLRKKDFGYAFLSSFVLWGMIPSIASLNGHSYAIRGILMVVGFATLTALGIVETWAIVKEYTTLKRMFLVIAILICVTDVSTFAYEYFGRRPITLSEVFNERERAVSEYIATLDQDSPLVIYDTDISTKNTFMSYAFLKITDTNKIQSIMKKDKYVYQYENVIFKRCETRKDHPQNTIAIVSNHCLNDVEYKKLKDRKLKEIIYKDTPILVAYFVIPIEDRK
jgi:4-amino-4-deoxy-L-arabinose transferase-like glycosyltransferase